MVKVIYILFWTWVLNLMCKDGHTGIAWFLVLLPFIMLFVIMGMVMMYQKKNKKEGMCCNNGNCGKNCNCGN
jgi:hypothetical protein